MSVLSKLIASKWFFFKPKKKKILIYDRVSKDFLGVFFNKNDYEILDVRYESINIYVIIVTLLKYNFSNFINNYKKTFIEIVSPKIVVSAIDNDIAFYKLKDIYGKPKYICFQNGLRTNNFYIQCKNYIKTTKKKLRADHIFLLGSNEKKRMIKIIKSEFHCLGSVKNNYYSISKKKRIKKIKSIMYISQFNMDMFKRCFYETFNEDKKIFNFLYKFCKEKKIKLVYGSKLDLSMENYIRNNLPKGDWIYHPRINTKKTYTNLNKQEMIVFSWSTLGFEALAKGIKCVSFHKFFPSKGGNIKYAKTGFFWSSLKNYYQFKKMLIRVISVSDSKWKKIANKYSSEILDYDPDNKNVKKILKKIIHSQ
jgi:surface carbohydrate biosynthesis protein